MILFLITSFYKYQIKNISNYHREISNNELKLTPIYNYCIIKDLDNNVI